MASRLELQTLLEKILESQNVYFQSPSSNKMKYPAIRYSLNSIDNTHANDDVYNQSKSYSITLIDFDPDSIFVDKLSKLQKCRFDRFYTADNLNHWVFTLYF